MNAIILQLLSKSGEQIHDECNLSTGSGAGPCGQLDGDEFWRMPDRF